jgi:hypothetical protein
VRSKLTASFQICLSIACYACGRIGYDIQGESASGGLDTGVDSGEETAPLLIPDGSVVSPLQDAQPAPGTDGPLRSPATSQDAQPSPGADVPASAQDMQPSGSGGDCPSVCTGTSIACSSQADCASAGDNVTAGLVAYYKAEGDTVDSSGNGNHGALYDGATYSSGVFGRAFNTLDRPTSSGHMLVPSSASINSITSDSGITISVWIYAHFWNASASYIVARLMDTGGSSRSASYHYTLGVSGSGNTIVFGNHAWSPSTALPTTRWIHLAFTWANGTVKGYENGNLVVTAPTTMSMSADVTPISFGVRKTPLGSVDAYRGLLDEVRIYNRPLSETEVKAIAKICPSATPTCGQ